MSGLIYNKSKKDKYKNTTKEERAKSLHHVICSRCGYQNRIYFVKKYGTCNCCGATLSAAYFKKMILRGIQNG